MLITQTVEVPKEKIFKNEDQFIQSLIAPANTKYYQLSEHQKQSGLYKFTTGQVIKNES